MHEPTSVAGHWNGGWDEPAVARWAAGLRARLAAPDVTLGLLLATPAFMPHASDLLEVVRLHARVPRLAGCSTAAVIEGAREHEGDEGLALVLLHLPGARLELHHVDDDRPGPGPSRPGDARGWILLADPFHLDGEAWLSRWNDRHPGETVMGGLASGNPLLPETQVYLDGTVHEAGAVAVGIGGGARLEAVVSQGCTPIGETWTVTRVEGNHILSIGNRPAYEVLAETFNAMEPAEQARTRGNLFVGFAGSEYRDEFRRGDFLVRHLLGVDPRAGAIAVGALPRAGQTIQFQRRDAAAAREDLAWMLDGARARLSGRRPAAALLASCLGRGRRLFGAADHDAAAVQAALGPVPLAGFQCNGEIGPVGDRAFVHGYTAALGLVVGA